MIYVLSPTLGVLCVSVQRAVYKDLVTLLQSNAYTTERELRTKVRHTTNTLVFSGYSLFLSCPLPVLLLPGAFLAP